MNQHSHTSLARPDTAGPGARRTPAILVCMLLASIAPAADATELEALGFQSKVGPTSATPDRISVGDVSADGSVVVGSREVWSGGSWTEKAIFLRDGALRFAWPVPWNDPGGNVEYGGSRAVSVSADGRTAGGAIEWGSPADGFPVGDWAAATFVTAPSGFTVPKLEYPIDSYPIPGNGAITAVSADGSGIVGWQQLYDPAFIAWSGYAAIGFTPPGPSCGIAARALSQDGEVVAILWSEGDILTACLPSETRKRVDGVWEALQLDDVFGLSADGSVAVGKLGGVAALESGGVVESIGDLPGGDAASVALDVSADGGVVVGWGTTAAGERAFVWTAESGIQDLSAVLTGLGVDVSGWTLERATAISSDGGVIVGEGIRPDGREDGFRASLAAPVPVPALGSVGATGLASALCLATMAGAIRRA